VALVLPNSLAATAEPSLSEARTSKATGEALRRSILTVSNSDEPLPPPGVTVGDTILSVNGNFVDSPAEVERMLLTTAEFGKPM